MILKEEVNENSKIILEENDIENKKEKIKKQIITIIKEVLKLFLIFNLVNVMQYIISGNLKMIKLEESLKNISATGMDVLAKNIIHLFDIKYFLNILLAFLVYVIIFSINNRKRMSLIMTIAILYFYEVINYVVTVTRGTAITILDVLSFQAALNVVKGINIKFTGDFIVGTVIFVFIIVIIFLLYKNNKKRNLVIRMASVAIAIVICIGMTKLEEVKNISIWNINDTYKEQGSNLTFLRLAMDLNVKKPNNYNKAITKSNLETYMLEEEQNIQDVNIIVIINESFADYIDNEFINMIDDNIPYFHTLQKEENVITGMLHSDSFGGNTANIEYEFLTQNTIAFLPIGAVPYQQYIVGKTESIVSRMNNLDYSTHAIHVWNKSGYNRQKVYNLLYFNEYKFREDYEDLENGINGYTTDQSAYKKIIEIFENKKEDEKVFSFNLTMANHLPYVTVDENEKEYSENHTANIYLQTEHKSDLALEELVTYIKQYNEKILLLFFGDHQPNMELEEIAGDEENKYKVPYLIWANYDIEEKEYGDTSTIFLQSILFEVANLPKDEYINYMLNLRKEIPVLTSHYYIGNNGIKYSIDDKTSPYYEKILEYEKIVYYKMFDN